MRFFDGGLPGEPGEPPDRAAPARILLERRTVDGEEAFAMLRRIGYDDRRLGQLLVPAEVRTFRSDLTSVPRFFTWLVPRSGRHLPAALLHDGLVETDETAPATYVSAEGHVVGRVAADRVFRDAMADLGVPPARRWLIWSAVTAATMLDGRSTGWSSPMRWWYRGAVVLTLGAVVVLGLLATLDLAGVGGVEVPWIGEGPAWLQLLQGAGGAVAIPAVLALAWGRFVVAGLITHLALALLLHVTAAVVAAYGLYLFLELLAGRGRVSGRSRSASTRRRSG